MKYLVLAGMLSVTLNVIAQDDDETAEEKKVKAKELWSLASSAEKRANRHQQRSLQACDSRVNATRKSRSLTPE